MKLLFELSGMMPDMCWGKLPAELHASAVRLSHLNLIHAAPYSACPPPSPQRHVLQLEIEEAYAHQTCKRANQPAGSSKAKGELMSTSTGRQRSTGWQHCNTCMEDRPTGQTQGRQGDAARVDHQLQPPHHASASASTSMAPEVYTNRFAHLMRPSTSGVNPNLLVSKNSIAVSAVGVACGRRNKGGERLDCPANFPGAPGAADVAQMLCCAMLQHLGSGATCKMSCNIRQHSPGLRTCHRNTKMAGSRMVRCLAVAHSSVACCLKAATTPSVGAGLAPRAVPRGRGALPAITPGERTRSSGMASAAPVTSSGNMAVRPNTTRAP